MKTSFASKLSGQETQHEHDRSEPAALSAQWDAEKHQLADEQDPLNVRIDDLTQLVQDFAARHEQHAAALQE